MKRLELTIAIIAALVSILSAALAYSAQTSATKSQAEVARFQAATQQAHERQKPFVELQMKYYFEAAETAAKIPRTSDPKDRHDLVIRFWQLYWGPLAVVEDEPVAAAMVEYGKELTKNSPSDPTLENLSLRVAHACRDSLKRLWVPELGDIQSIRPKSE